MIEKQTFPQEAEVPKQDGEIISDAELAMFNEWSAAPDAARRTVDLSPPTHTQEPAVAEMLDNVNTSPQKRQPSARVRRNRGAAAAALTVAVTAGGLGAIAGNAMAAPDFSEETTTYTVEQGDGLYDAAHDILGSNTIDMRDAVEHISTDPANIDVLKDGLQPGEQLVIPIAVAGHEHDDTTNK